MPCDLRAGWVRGIQVMRNRSGVGRGGAGARLRGRWLADAGWGGAELEKDERGEGRPQLGKEKTEIWKNILLIMGGLWQHIVS